MHTARDVIAKTENALAIFIVIYGITSINVLLCACGSVRVREIVRESDRESAPLCAHMRACAFLCAHVHACALRVCVSRCVERENRKIFNAHPSRIRRDKSSPRQGAKRRTVWLGTTLSEPSNSPDVRDSVGIFRSSAHAPRGKISKETIGGGCPRWVSPLREYNQKEQTRPLRWRCRANEMQARQYTTWEKQNWLLHSLLS